MPIGLYSVGAALKESRHDVEILNWHHMGKAPGKMRAILQRKRPGVIGFSILHGNRWGGIEIARIAKQVDPQVKIVFGGIGATFLWKHLLTHFGEIDTVVLGEGEYTFLSLLRHYEEPGSMPLEKIRGIAFRKKTKIVKTQEAPPIQDLDKLPIPARHFAYQHVSSTRGCAWNCTFCGSPRFWGRKIRFRSPGHFVEELAMLYRKGVHFFYFSDDTFTFKKGRAIEICKRILEKGLEISWYAISRVNHVDEELLSWMRRAGCIQISYGIESGSMRIRKTLNKHIVTSQIRRAFELTTRYGILSRAYFIYGSPGETWGTIQETIDLIDEIRPLAVIFYILDIFPGTELYEQFKKRTGVTDDIWLNKIEGVMHFETDPDLSDQLILSFGEKLREEFFGKVHAFADSISLADQTELYQKHADFCSRLAMTFSHGDYAGIQSVREKQRVSEELYLKALDYHPDRRAYLGLGILRQKTGNYRASVEILSEGVGHFPDDPDLNVCLGISRMNMGDYEEALSCFSRFPGSEQAVHFAAECRRALKG